MQPIDNGVLLYNTLSCEMVLLEGDEVEHLYELDYLRENWFLVPENFDDKKFYMQFRSLYKLLTPKPKGISNYTILTTTDCNARCFYCYEKGRSRIPMTIETADRLVEYIIANKNNNADKDSKVGLHWFGGEPLYNNKVIYHICNKLSEAGIEYKSYMVSNGYLFNPDLVNDAKNLWNLKRVQITLDGTESTYNKSKAYIHDDKSPYQRVLRNIQLLLDAHIRVVVRMNIDMYNADDLIALAAELNERFLDKRGLFCYSFPLFEAAGDKLRERTEHNRRVVFEKQQQLVDKLVEYGLHRYSPVSKEIAVVQCMANNGSSVVVAPTGQLGLCEHYSESEFFSSLYTPGKVDKDVVKSFGELHDEVDLCHDCAIRPQCIRLKKCIERSLCFAELKQSKIAEMQHSMIRTYEKWLKAKAEGEQEESIDDDDILNTNC